MILPRFPRGIHLIDFEFHPRNGREGNPPHPVCLVVREWPSGATRRFGRDELEKMSHAPYPTDPQALTVAYFASAEMNCFLALGWPLPANILDLYVEFRCRTNGLKDAGLLPHGSGLLGALLYFGLDSMAAEDKQHMRELILTGGPWSEIERVTILDYCESDVVALASLLPAMESGIDLDRALLRGAYMKAVAHMEFTGIPLDAELLSQLMNSWADIQDALIARIDQDYEVFEGRVFKAARFERLLSRRGIPWPRLPSGEFDLKDDTFRDMAKAYPFLAPLHQLKAMMSKLHSWDLVVGDDGRNRCLLSPFASKTGRNQPSTSRFIFGPPRWMRGLIRPAPGWGLAYVDWSQQEFGIAAALSNDGNMIQAYQSGDPYLEFAKQAGAVPSSATKKSHKAERDQFKACVLAVQYGMGAESLAIRIGQPVARARQLLELHRRTYPTFWAWSDGAVNRAVLGRDLWTVFGWQFHLHGRPNDRSLRNFPMQANGAEMMRIASILLVEKGIGLCAPIHDALLVEAPLGDLDEVVAETQAQMRKASSIILDGFELTSDAKIVRFPERYMDENGIALWDNVMELISRPEYKVGGA